MVLGKCMINAKRALKNGSGVNLICLYIADIFEENHELKKILKKTKKRFFNKANALFFNRLGC